MSKKPKYITDMFFHCRKKKDFGCRFNIPLALSIETRILCSVEKIDENTVKQSKKLLEKVLSRDLSDITTSEILGECGVTTKQFDSA